VTGRTKVQRLTTRKHAELMDAERFDAPCNCLVPAHGAMRAEGWDGNDLTERERANLTVRQVVG
jgi:hypothetical protein